jgi:hypothetical protein
MIYDAVIAEYETKSGDFRENVLWVILATLTFIVFFYSGTLIMSMVYPLDKAPIAF